MQQFRYWIALTALLCGVAAADTGPVVLRTAAQTGTEPKFVEETRDGNTLIRGFCVDVFRAIESVDSGLNFTGEQRWVPTARVDAMLERGELDVICGVGRTDDRVRRFDFIEPPIVAARFLLVSRRDDPVDVRELNDLKRLSPDNTVLINTGFSIGQLLRQLGLPLDAGAADPASNLAKLMAGRARFYCYREPGLRYELTRLGLLGKVKIHPYVVDTTPLMLMVSRQLAPSTRARLSSAMSVLVRRGQLDDILSRW